MISDAVSNNHKGPIMGKAKHAPGHRYTGNMPLHKAQAEVRALRVTIKTIEDLANHGVNNPGQALASIYDLAAAVNKD